MNIHENTALLDAFVDGELTSEEMISVQSHLDECPECRAYVDDVLAIRASFPTVSGGDRTDAARHVGQHQRQQQYLRCL